VDFTDEGAVDEEFEIATSGDDEKLVGVAWGLDGTTAGILDEVFIGSSGTIAEKVLASVGDFEVVELSEI
jgi:hypothetical protein